MDKYESWSKIPGRFLSMTGLSQADFDRLLVYFTIAHDRYLSRHEMSGRAKRSTRKFVIYKSSPLTTHAERLCFILFYLKHNPVQELQADTFGMEQGQCNEYIHGLRRILDLALERAQVMPARTNEAFQKIANQLDSQELIHDGTEREVPRPQNEEAQKDQYSGKKRRHTVKNAVIATMIGTVLYLSATCSGSIHDKRLAESYTIPEGFSLWQDTGYQGYAPEGVVVVQPKKKPKGGELTEEQKHMNRSISSVRVRIEHFIGGIKRFRIVKDECRAYARNFRDAVMGTCTGLYNFRIAFTPPKYNDNQ
jgi:DDE superfamily endonuclease/Helix-turn-helix of DDE superfamily endonuclease